ncbi:cytochrome P450 1A1-like [Mya arenaria]|uniref:cytochrome P450 1A1-like n=1 Tax=Mya arenaria TaxID=6604 RepID=UPI0022E2BDBF|nr:cytochrome P450 1A1-like [Mya arenaria]
MLDFNSLCAIVIAILGLILSYCYIQQKWIFSDRKYPDGPWGFPVVGHLPLLGKFPPKQLMAWRKIYGDVYRIRLGSWPAIVVNGYAAVKEATLTAGDAFSGRPDFVSAQVLRSRTGDEDFAFGTFSPAYVKQRKLLAQALRMFTYTRQSFVEEIVDTAAKNLGKTLVAKFSKLAGSLADDVQFAVASIMYQILYGKSKQVDKDKHVRVIANGLEEINRFTGSGSPIDVMPWLRYVMPGKLETLRNLQCESDKIMLTEVEEHYKTFDKDNLRDITDAFLNAAEQLKQDDEGGYELTKMRMIMSLFDLQSAGIDTTQKMTLWLVLYMAAYPAVQGRVQEEIDSVVGQERPPALADKPRLVYTEAVIQEVMRIVTILPVSLPHYAIEDSKICGYHVDKDTVVILNMFSVSHEAKVWDDPDNFRPERFLTESGEINTSLLGHSLPFGLGRRRCVGEQLAKINLFILFSSLMQQCHFTLSGSADLTPIPGLVYTPENCNIMVQNRN